MYLKTWTEFIEAAEKLLLANPTRTRYTIKYRHKDGAMVLKVTDDRVCLKFRTDQAADFKKLEKLNMLFLRHMTSKIEPQQQLPPIQPPAPAGKKV
jgi:signal recognition particle subunit SRP9